MEEIKISSAYQKLKQLLDENATIEKIAYTAFEPFSLYPSDEPLEARDILHSLVLATEEGFELNKQEVIQLIEQLKYFADREWKEIISQEDIDVLMNKFNSFHDSCIKSFNYTSGVYVENDSSMVMDGYPSIHIIFDSQSTQFTGLEMQLGMVNKFVIDTDLFATLEILGAKFHKRDDGFYWYSDKYQCENSNYWFRCQKIMYRLL